MCLAVPGLVVDTQENGWNRIAKVKFGEVTRQVSLDFVPEVEAGDYVLVHVGFAIAKVDPAEAQRTLDHLAEMRAIEEIEGLSS